MSRVTFAITLAAAMLRLKQSPSMIAVCGSGNGKTGQAIDEHVFGLSAQRVDGGAHRLVRRAQNIDRVDLDRIDDADRPGDRAVADEFVVNFFAPFGEELLGIVQPAMPKFFREITAAATTGPASAPRPASSMPAMRETPSARNLRSCRKPQRRYIRADLCTDTAQLEIRTECATVSEIA